ncbi:MAG TPA: DUF2341 domain-containing protein [Methanothermococcus okinawensis]|uniref:DUF2341 domain-containing protein n=1 Tax=Methanothermococcus okinawensis TaxID=155863 RepID=A0A832ZYP9_9EURY|nr:DUF2341 domain-containing protein [Methanothermococcus okinawensis]
MLGLSKLKSKKGYIFTFEAVVAVMIALLVFYVGYFAITHNILTFQEKKRDIEAFEKSNLIADKIFKDYEFPSNSYVPDYLRFVEKVRESYYTTRDTIPGTFDPFSVRGIEDESNVTYERTWEYIINISNPNNYTLKDFQVLVVLTPSNFNFDFSPHGKGISFWENKSGTLEEIPYWIEIWKYNRIGRVWIRVSEIPANGYTIVYLKRDEGGSSSIRDNGEAVFLFFDDFEDKNLWDKWEVKRGEKEDWEIIEDNELPFYNKDSKNHVAHLKPSSRKYRSIISKDPIKVSDGEIYILEAVVKGHTGAVGGSADSPDTMVGFYASPEVKYFFNSFTGWRQIFRICFYYDDPYSEIVPVSTKIIFTYDNVWYHEKFILEHKNNPGLRICNASIWRFFNGYYGDPNPNDNRESMIKVYCNVTVQPSIRKHVVLGTGQGTHSEEYWFDNVRARRYAPKINVDVRENIQESVKTVVVRSPYYFENIPEVTSNVNIIRVVYPVQNFSNTYVKTESRLVPVKMWRYGDYKEISENISKGEILYFGTRRPSDLEYIKISAKEPVKAVISVNGIPFEMEIDTTPKISGFGKVINRHKWEMYQPNEIKILYISKDVPITLDIKYSENCNIYVLKFKPVNISCVLPLKN